MKLLNFFKIFTLLAFVLLVSCSEDETVKEEIIENQLNINIDGVEYKSTNAQIGGNENCDKLFINASYIDKNKIDFTIKFDISKDGKLLKVWYEEYVLPLTSIHLKSIFLTPNFRPLSTFNISNFSYNGATGYVEFNFNGKVFFEQNNNVERNISGTLKIKSLKTVNCTISKTGLMFESPQLSLFSFYNSRIQFLNLTQQHRFFSNNGYRIYINTSGDLWNYPLGEITFTENDIINNVEFKKAIGPIFADQIQNVNQQQWKDYQTSGKIVLLNKTIENNEKVISGKLFLTVKDNNQINYELNGIDFKTGSFVN